MFTYDHEVSVRVTARTDEQRDYHLTQILKAITAVTDGATVEYGWAERDSNGALQRRGAWGFWGPTNEYEPSPVIRAYCENPQAVLDAAAESLATWLVECKQDAALIVVDGKPWFLETAQEIRDFHLPE